MFDSICIRNQSQTDTAIDVGFLAESMLFYSDVHVIASEGIIRQLAKTCGPEVLVELIQRGHLKLAYEQQLTGIHTTNSGTTNELHSAITFSSPQHDLQLIAPELFMQLTGKSGKARRLANRFTRLVDTIERPRRILSDFRSDVLDNRYLQSTVRQVLSYCAPEYSLPDPLIFEIQEVGQELAVVTNIDFVQLNRSYHLHVPPSHSSMTPALLLGHILTARDNLYFASTLKADLALNPISSQVLVSKVNFILDRYQYDVSQLSTFQDFLFDDGRAIAESINSGEKSFADWLKILERADNFRQWLKDKPPDANLAKDYFREVTHSSWIDNLPGKGFRWALFTGAGLVVDALGAGGAGTAIGIAISTADSFLLDPIIKGWKPDQFVNGPLRKFVEHK
jgi:hypothetical protein